jgi:membrane-bound lytic murein transglycosylase F
MSSCHFPVSAARIERALAFAVILCLGLAGAACDFSPTPRARSSNHTSTTLSSSGLDGYEEIADLSDIRSRRKLRVLLPSLRTELSYPAPEASAHQYEVDLVKRFAERNYLEVDWIHVDRWEQLIPFLVEGRGDLIAANITITENRKQKIAFTVPIDTIREKLVVRAGDHIKSLEDLVGREIAVRERSSFWDLLKRFRQQHPGIDIRLLPEHIPAYAVLSGISSGEYDIAVVDIGALESTSRQWPDLKVIDGLTRESIIAWGVHPDAQELLLALNGFLNKEQLKKQSRLLYKEDFSGIKKRKVLRVLTRNNAATYFIWRGKLLGFEYELMKRFADNHDLHLEMIVPKRWDDVIPTLREGGGDLIAASLTISQRRVNQGLAFSAPYNYVHEVLVARADDTGFDGIENLGGRTVVVRRTSSYWNTMEELQAQGFDFTLAEAPEKMETEEIIARVASGEYDLTVSDSHILDVELIWRNDIKAAGELRGPVPHGWAVRNGDVELLAALNAFLEKEYRGLFYNVTYEKYFENPRRMLRHVAAREQKINGSELSPYDELVRKYAEQYGFDWPLIVAQMYQESRFDPEAESWAGAQGLMQVMPTTAEYLGFADMYSVDPAIHAGVQYLAWLHERFEPELTVQDRMWFSLAAYNAGIGHVRDARQLARRMGWDPNRWFNNVERAILLLSRRSFYQLAPHGYVRGQETVDYVRQIRDRYNAYVRLANTSTS